MYICYCPLRDLNWNKIYCIVLYCIVLYCIHNLKLNVCCIFSLRYTNIYTKSRLKFIQLPIVSKIFKYIDQARESYSTPSLLKKSLSISKNLYPFKRVSTPIRRNLFTRDDGNFTADLQNVSFMSLDESIGKIEVDPKEEASVVEVCQDVLDKLSDVGKKDKLLKFFKVL